MILPNCQCSSCNAKRANEAMHGPSHSSENSESNTSKAPLITPLERIEAALVAMEATVAESNNDYEAHAYTLKGHLDATIAALRVVLKAGNGTFAQFYSEEIAKALTGGCEEK